MSNSIPVSTLEKFTSFGDLLRYLRRRAGLTQLELSIAVGYSDPHISRLEQNMRLPDPPTIQARFITPLCLEDEPRAVARLLELAAEVRREDAPAPGLCPYKGMDYFDEADADLFVGREALTDKLVNDVLAIVSNEQANSGKFLSIVGASGSGKSSLVRAGLVPALRWDKTSANWPIHIITPSAHPLENLASTLVREPSLAATAALMDDLACDQRTLSLYIKHELKTNPGSYVLLVIDQFEEMFTLCRSETERSAFIDNLLTAAFDADVKAIVVITLRADFYAHCASFPHLRQALAKHQEYIGALSDEEMRRAIEEPARRGRWEFEPGLVDLILHDVGHEPGALPLLSHALLETWQRRHGRTLTFSGYASSGGVRGAIAETAEAVFTDQFNHDQQAIARRIFLRLTELGDETATGDTRRRATFGELILRPEESDATQAVLKTLADARLVTTSENSVEVAHEALIREWPTLRGWLEDNREGLRLHHQLSESAQEWLEAEREADILFRGARLAQAREWAEMHADDMNALEKEFLDASVESSERDAAEREAAHQRELEAAQKLADTQRLRAEEGIRSAQRLRRRAILVSLVGAIAVLLAVFAIFAWQRSSTQAAINHSLVLAGVAEKLTTAGQGDLALVLAMEAVKSNPTQPEARTTLRTVATGFGTRAILPGHSQAVMAVALSPDAKTAISGSCAQMDAQGKCTAGELIVWDIDARKVLHQWSAHAGWVTAVAISPDGQKLISGADDGSLIVWDLNGEQPQQLIDHGARIADLVVVAKTNQMLSASADGTLLLWDLGRAEVVQQFESISRNITSIAVAESIPVAVSAHQDGSIRLWDLGSPKSMQSFPNMGLGINSIAIFPDGSRILYTTSQPPDLYIRMIDGKSGEKWSEKSIGCLPGDFALSPDLTYALMICTNGIYQVDLQNWSLLNAYQEYYAIQSAITVSKDGQLAISAVQDGTIRVWNLGASEDYQTINVAGDPLTAIATSPDGRYLLLNDAEKNGYNQPALWDIAERKVIRTYRGFDVSVSPGATAISPNNRYVAAAGMNFNTGAPKVTLWDFENSAPRCNLEGFTENGRALAFSPDSQYLLGGSQVVNGKTGHLILWDVRSCNIVRIFDTIDEVSSVRFNADGTRVVTGTSMLGKVTLWDVATGKEIRHFTYYESDIVLGVAFGPGDDTILSTSTGELHLWDIATGRLIRSYTGNLYAPWSLDISPDGKYILSGIVNGDVILWDFNTGEKLGEIKTNNAVFDVRFSPDSLTAYGASAGGELVEWHLAVQSFDELQDWIIANRYVRELTPEEKLQYHVEP